METGSTTLYIHIGLPKTGTSAIQEFLTLNRKELLNHGILYPEECIIKNAHYPLAWVLNSNFPSFKRLKNKSASDIWSKINSEILNNKPLKVVISSEDFIHVENLDLLKNVFLIIMLK